MIMHGHWTKIETGNDRFLLHNDPKELAIVETMDGSWVVLHDKSNPHVLARYDSCEEAYAEWSHA
jgi:hypothetical protein